MACGLESLRGGLASSFPYGRIGNPLFVGEPWFFGCGQTNVSCKVVGGKLVEAGKWPWQVSILFMGVYICSGSLIHHQWLLTAAHCLERSFDAKQYTVMVGVQHLQENGTEIHVTHLVIHENFKNLMSDDIALLKLEDPVPWSPFAQPICLPTTKLVPSIGSSCWAIVWGRPSTRATPKPSYNLQEVSVKIMQSDICNRAYRFLFLKGQQKFIEKSMLCATSQWGVDSCQVNSGSSLVCQVNKTWVQMGVESWSFSCKKHHFPNVYTSTSHFTQWIKKQIADIDFVSRAEPAFLSPVFHIGYIPLVSLGSLWLL